MERNVIDDSEYSFLHLIQGSDRWRSAMLVGGGWSSDLKFKVLTIDGEEILLRVSNIKSLEKKKAEYAAICQVDKLGILMSKPYEFGTLEEAGKLYMKLAWIDGDNVEEAMPKLTATQQYEAGIKAGQLLRKLHTLPSNLTAEQWKQKNIKVLTERDALYRSCDYYKIKHYDEMMRFINDSMYLLDNRPLSFHHGDFQGRNIIITSKGEVGVID